MNYTLCMVHSVTIYMTIYNSAAAVDICFTILVLRVLKTPFSPLEKCAMPFIPNAAWLAAALHWGPQRLVTVKKLVATQRAPLASSVSMLWPRNLTFPVICSLQRDENVLLSDTFPAEPIAGFKDPKCIKIDPLFRAVLHQTVTSTLRGQIS